MNVMSCFKLWKLELHPNPWLEKKMVKGLKVEPATITRHGREALVGPVRPDRSVVVWECISPALENITEEHNKDADKIVDDQAGTLSPKDPPNSPWVEKKQPPAKNHQMRVSGGFMLLLVLAALVLLFFLLSPDIEAIFSKYCIMIIII